MDNVVNELQESLKIVDDLYLLCAANERKLLQRLMAKLVWVSEEISSMSPKSLKRSESNTGRQKIKNKEAVLIAACYFSRFGHEGLFKNLNQTKSLEKAAEIFEMKPKSFKATRDIFDPFFDNGRKGWLGRALKKDELKVFNTYAKMPQNLFEKKVKNILGIN